MNFAVELLDQKQLQEARAEFDAAVALRHHGQRVVHWDTMFQFPMVMLPGLRAHPFWEDPARLFDTASRLEAHHDLIQQDLHHIPESAWQLQNDGDLIGQGSWTEFAVLHKGVWRGCKVTPNTCKILRGLQELDSSPPSQRLSAFDNQVSFLRLSAGSRLRSHTGPHNARLVLHLGLSVPIGAGISVANETRRWRKGRVLAFDDSFTHKAWNDGPDNRIVLYSTIWHPDTLGVRQRQGKSGRVKKSEL